MPERPVLGDRERSVKRRVKTSSPLGGQLAARSGDETGLVEDFHGVFAPNYRLRARIVPEREPEEVPPDPEQVPLDLHVLRRPCGGRRTLT